MISIRERLLSGEDFDQLAAEFSDDPGSKQEGGRLGWAGEGKYTEAFEEVIKINLTSAFVTLSIACKQMLRNGGGRVVFTSSVAGSLGLVNHEAISAAKGGVESMVRSAAATYSRRGIRVNAVAPGLTDTRLSYPITKSENSKKAAVDRIPINRINEAEEIVTTINWLLTDAPDNITGQIFHLDGGMSKVRN